MGAPRDSYALPCLALVAALCYGSVVVSSYGFSDDYVFLLGVVKGELPGAVAIPGGRPVYAALMALGFGPLRDIGDLRYLRLAAVIGVLLLAFFVYLTLVSKGWPPYRALALAVVVLALPSSQVYAAWATAGLQVWATLASYMSFRQTERALASPSGTRATRATAFAVLWLLIAFAIHQSAAMYYWVFAAAALFAPETTWDAVRRRSPWYVGVASAALVLAYGVYRVGMVVGPARAISVARSGLTTDVWEKVQWFVRESLISALNLVYCFPEPWIAVGWAWYVVGGLVLYLRGGPVERLYQLVLAIAIVPVSYLPNLLVAENWATYRTQTALTSIVVLYVFLATCGYERLLRSAPAVRGALRHVAPWVFAAACGVLAAHNVQTYFIFPQTRELGVMREQLARFEASGA